jgi:hypothetical protein
MWKGNHWKAGRHSSVFNPNSHPIDVQWYELSNSLERILALNMNPNDRELKELSELRRA